MKTIALSLCMIQGTVDSKNGGKILLELVSSDNEEVQFMSMSNELLPPNVKEGDKIYLTVLTDEDTMKYCH